jgi:hypothetical protein
MNESERLQAQIAEADRAIAVQVRALEEGIEPDMVRARIEELKAEKAAAQAFLRSSNWRPNASPGGGARSGA